MREFYLEKFYIFKKKTVQIILYKLKKCILVNRINDTIPL